MSTPTPRLSLRCRRCGEVRFRAWRRAACTRCGGDGFDEVDTAVALAEAAATAVDEYTAAEVLFQLRFGGEWGCARCGHPQCTHLRSRPRAFECNRCGAVTSVTAGTALHRCRLPLTVVLRAAARLSERLRSVSARALARELGLPLETAWSLGHRLRAGFLDPEPIRLGDDVIWSTVHARARPPWRGRDETMFGNHPLTVLWDATRRVVVTTGRPDVHSLRRLVDRHADVERPLEGRFLLRDRPWEAASRTHRGVSPRWLPLYAHAMGGWHNARVTGRSPPLETLRRTLASDRHPFRRLRPRTVPTRAEHWHSSWAAEQAHYARWLAR